MRHSCSNRSCGVWKCSSWWTIFWNQNWNKLPWGPQFQNSFEARLTGDYTYMSSCKGWLTQWKQNEGKSSKTNMRQSCWRTFFFAEHACWTSSHIEKADNKTRQESTCFANVIRKWEQKHGSKRSERKSQVEADIFNRGWASPIRWCWTNVSRRAKPCTQPQNWVHNWES